MKKYETHEIEIGERKNSLIIRDVAILKKGLFCVHKLF